jgi:hypothetical protein
VLVRFLIFIFTGLEEMKALMTSGLLAISNRKRSLAMKVL